MTDAAWHALVIVSFLLVGVPSNVAVLWIHTRKNSRVAKNRFPLIFAVTDLFALVTSLPVQRYAFKTRGETVSDNLYLNATFLCSVNGYLMTLFMATIDKFYAVMFPFKYGKRSATFFKIAVFISLVPNTVLAIALTTILDTLGHQAFVILLTIYNVIIGLIFLTIIIFYIIIITNLIRNRRNLSKIKDSG